MSLHIGRSVSSNLHVGVQNVAIGDASLDMWNQLVTRTLPSFPGWTADASRRAVIRQLSGIAHAGPVEYALIPLIETGQVTIERNIRRGLIGDSSVNAVEISIVVPAPTGLTDRYEHLLINTVDRYLASAPERGGCGIPRVLPTRHRRIGVVPWASKVRQVFSRLRPHPAS